MGPGPIPKKGCESPATSVCAYKGSCALIMLCMVIVVISYSMCINNNIPYIFHWPAQGKHEDITGPVKQNILA